MKDAKSLISDGVKSDYEERYLSNEANGIKEDENNYGLMLRRDWVAAVSVEECIETYNPETFIDFGCGSGGNVIALNRMYPGKCFGYDPCFLKYQDPPIDSFDMLISFDVLEHVEPENIKDTLRYIDTLFTKVAYLFIATTAASGWKLSDGRNPHLIQENGKWWRKILSENINADIIHEEDIKQYSAKKLSKMGKGQIKNLPPNKYLAILKK